MNLNELSEKQEGLPWQDVYPSLRYVRAEFIRFLEDVLPSSLLNRADRDYVRDELIENSLIDHKLQTLRSRLDSFDSYESLLLEFILSSEALELCGKTRIEELTQNIDWESLLQLNYRSSLMRNRDAPSWHALQQIIENEGHSGFVSQMKLLDKESRIEIIKVMEDLSLLRPFFSPNLLEEIFEFKPAALRLSLENIDLMTLPDSVYETIFFLAEPSFILNELPDIFSKKDHGYYRLLFFYLIRGREPLLKLIFQGVSLKQIIREVHNFFTDEETRNCKYPVPSSSLPPIRFKDNERDSGEENDSLLIDFLKESILESEETVNIIMDLLFGDYESWVLLDDILEEDEKEEVVDILVERIIHYSEIIDIDKKFKSLSIQQLRENEPSLVLLSIFRQALLTQIAEGAEIYDSNYLLFFLKPFYDVKEHNRYTFTQDQNKSFSQFLLKKLNQKSNDSSKLQKLFLLRNELFKDIAPNWINWIIERVVAIESIGNIRLDWYCMPNTPGDWEMNFSRVLQSPLTALFNSGNRLLLDVLKGISDYYTYNALPCLISCLFVNDRDHFNEWFHKSHWLQSESSILQNLNGIILFQDRGQYNPFELLEKMDHVWRFSSMFPIKQDDLDHFLNAWGISRDDVMEYVLHRIHTWTGSDDDLKKWYYSFRSCFIQVEEKGPYGLTNAGIALFSALIELLSEEFQDMNDLRILRVIKDEAWIIKESLPQEIKDNLLTHCRNRLDRQRSIIRGYESCQDPVSMMRVTDFCFTILANLSDSVKAIRQKLNNFRFLDRITVSPDLVPLPLSPQRPEVVLTESIQKDFMHNFEKGEGLHIRRELAAYVSDKLKPKRDESLTEPDPIWRTAYVHALGDLGIHSRGKGHTYYSILNKVAQNDISPEVKKAAEKACLSLNKERSGVASGSSKRRLLNAWWWIRQAHLLTLGGVYDQKKAEITRFNEVR